MRRATRLFAGNETVHEVNVSAKVSRTGTHVRVHVVASDHLKSAFLESKCLSLNISDNSLNSR